MIANQDAELYNLNFIYILRLHFSPWESSQDIGPMVRWSWPLLPLENQLLIF